MMRTRFEEDWERKRRYLIRTMFADPPALSPIYESQEFGSEPVSPQASAAARCNDSPLPELIIEKVSRRRGWEEDETDEFYRHLAKRMRRYYRELFDLTDGDSSIETDVSEDSRTLELEQFEKINSIATESDVYTCSEHGNFNVTKRQKIDIHSESLDSGSKCGSEDTENSTLGEETEDKSLSYQDSEQRCVNSNKTIVCSLNEVERDLVERGSEAEGSVWDSNEFEGFNLGQENSEEASIKSIILPMTITNQFQIKEIAQKARIEISGAIKNIGIYSSEDDLNLFGAASLHDDVVERKEVASRLNQDQGNEEESSEYQNKRSEKNSRNKLNESRESQETDQSDDVGNDEDCDNVDKDDRGDENNAEHDERIETETEIGNKEADMLEMREGTKAVGNYEECDEGSENVESNYEGDENDDRGSTNTEIEADSDNDEGTNEPDMTKTETRIDADRSEREATESHEDSNRNAIEKESETGKGTSTTTEDTKNGSSGTVGDSHITVAEIEGMRSRNPSPSLGSLQLETPNSSSNPDLVTELNYSLQENNTTSDEEILRSSQNKEKTNDSFEDFHPLLRTSTSVQPSQVARRVKRSISDPTSETTVAKKQLKDASEQTLQELRNIATQTEEGVRELKSVGTQIDPDSLEDDENPRGSRDGVFRISLHSCEIIFLCC